MAAETLAEADLYDTAEPGGPIVRPLESTDEGDANCPLVWLDDRAKLAGVPWMCTRDRDHAGQHVAEGREEILSTYPNHVSVT